MVAHNKAATMEEKLKNSLVSNCAGGKLIQVKINNRPDSSLNLDYKESSKDMRENYFVRLNTLQYGFYPSVSPFLSIFCPASLMKFIPFK